MRKRNLHRPICKNHKMMRTQNILIFNCMIVFMLLTVITARAQYPPAAGQAGSTAMYKDSSAFVSWASGCILERGYQNISDTSLGLTTTGDGSMALGNAGTNGVVSLGDKGSATLTFDWPIVNGNSWDFAVFENSFDDYFLELAFVEVSSDGLNFYRFPSSSHTDTSIQVTTFDSLDATKINNLAGKYRGLYGTPFDLEELKNEAGLDVNHITHIRIQDVTGCLQTIYASFDADGRKINDPWPTPFPAGGFDLDAVGVIWNTTNVVDEKINADNYLNIFPNPSSGNINVKRDLSSAQTANIYLLDMANHVLLKVDFREGEDMITIDTRSLAAGVYILKYISDETIIFKKIIIK
jgi:hypothetical protein